MRPTALTLLFFFAPGLAAGSEWVRLPGAEAFESVLKYEDSGGKVRVAPFELTRTPVTNAEFLAFVTTHPEWRRGVAPPIFAETRYLQHWTGH